MHFVVHAIDRPDALARRLEAIGAHRAYLDQAPSRHNVRVLLSGPLTTDDGAAMIGSFLLLEAPNREAIEGLLAGDPMHEADVWGDLSVSAFSLRQDNLSGDRTAP